LEKILSINTHESDAIDFSSWQTIVSGDAQLRLSTVLSGPVPLLRMDYDFKGGGGFVVARRAISREMPEDYAVHFKLRGHGAVNNLEIKLVDASGQNVWRHVRKDLTPPRRWKRFNIASRDIDFAWGPLGSGSISTLGSVEFAIVAGAGGTGTLWLSELGIENRTPSAPPQVTASSALADFPAAAALQGPGWKPQTDDAKPWIIIDSTQARTIGGLIIDWLERAPAKGFRIAASNTGTRWKTVYQAATAGGRRTYVSLPALHTRYLRLRLNEPSAGVVIKIQSFEFSRSAAAFWNSIARGEARGWHPRWVHREQSLWTPFGAAAGAYCALLNDDGMAEAGLGSFSLEPMLWIGGRLVTWADVSARQQLLEGWMPVPSVVWESGDWRLTIRADASQSGIARLHYRLENLTAQPCAARLFILLRPFQVTPPWQNFRKLGGMSPIHDLKWQDGEVIVNAAARLVLEQAAAQGAPRFAALGFNDGFMPEHLASGTLPATTAVTDASGFATGAIGFDFMLEAHQAADSSVSYLSGPASYQRAEPAFDWGSRLPVRQWRGSNWATDAIAAALTATAHVLVTRDGPALQPGPRRYTRTWIRDAAMMSAALLRMGHATEVHDFIRWYCPFQRADGFVPCCVDREGVDWLVEHDSHGEWLELIADYFSFTSDLSLVRELWPSIEKAVGFIERALESNGLMPISVSHEGYLAQPVHAYWDDFWTVRGLRDAAQLARSIGDAVTAQHWHDLGVRLSASLFASIDATCAQRNLEFIPGSIEWADFDPTATANAVYLLDVPAGLNRGALERTFDKYLADWRAKRSGALAWTNYTPYEIRNIGALVRLDRRSDALELLRFFLSDRRPRAWNQWPEIAWADQHTPAHLGDLPHTWIAGEYVLAVRCLFAYELETDPDGTLIVAGGIAPEWLEDEGVQVEAMPTRFGPLTYTLRRLDASTLSFKVAAGFAGKIVLRPPLIAALRSVSVNGNDFTAFDASSVTLSRNPERMPLEVICITTP
jgi:F5/8 type C domain